VDQRAGSHRLLRQINDRAALLALLERGSLTRLELESAIGLSKPATAELLARLEESGQVVRAGLREGGRGPRAQRWSVNGGLAHVAAVDLTANELDVAVADLTGVVAVEHRYALDPGGAPLRVDDLRDAVASAAGRLDLRTDDLQRVVVGVPGAVDPRTGQLNFAPHLPSWQGFDVLDRLRATLGTTVVVENDVNLVALDELAAGRALGVRDFVLLWMGRGIGAGVVSDGRLLRGASGGAGELNWMPYGTTEQPARIGDVLGVRAVGELAQAHGLPGDDLVLALAGGPGVDPAARSAFLGELARRVAVVVAGVVSVVDPALVLLSGDIGRAGGGALCDLVREALAELVVPRPAVEPSLTTGNPVRSGALRLALEQAREEVFAVQP
jgi:predicted NBD/HSP70 family sugar kinase